MYKFNNESFGSGGREDYEAESARNPRKVKAYFIRLAINSKDYATQLRYLSLAIAENQPAQKPQPLPETDPIAD